MAIFKKKSATSNNKSASNMPTEFVEVVSYDLQANEIIARRIEKGGEEVRIGFLPVANPGKYARPEVPHFVGKTKKPRDMTTPAGGLLKLNRQGVSEDLTDGKLMVSWVDAWVRNPSEEFVFKGTASVTYLAEKEGLRGDGTKGYKGLMTVLCDDRFADTSKDGVLAERIWQGKGPALAKDAADLASKLGDLIGNNLSSGVRFIDDSAEAGSKLAAAIVYPKYGVSPSDVVSTFISNLDEDALSQIGETIRCEVIPAISLQIGNDTAGEMLTGKKSDEKPSHMGKVREMFSATVEQKEKTVQVPKFMDAGVLVRMRTPRQGDAYLSVENVTPLFGPQCVGIANAILAASTPNSKVFSDKAVDTPMEKQAPAEKQEQAPDNVSMDEMEASGVASEDDIENFFGGQPEEEDLSDIFSDADETTAKPSSNKMR